MYRQIGIDALEYECAVLAALNRKDRLHIEVELESMRLSDETIDSIREIYLSSISERDMKISLYTQQINSLRIYHDSQSSLLSEESYEFLYQEFLSSHLHVILNSIEKYYDSEVQKLLSQGVCNFTFSAKKTAKYILYHHGVAEIVNKHLNSSKERKLEQAILLLSEKMLSNYHGDDISRIISSQYEYYRDRLACNLDIGNKIRSL